MISDVLSVISDGLSVISDDLHSEFCFCILHLHMVLIKKIYMLRVDEDQFAFASLVYQNTSEEKNRREVTMKFTNFDDFKYCLCCKNV